MAENQFNHNIQTLRTNNGGEFTSLAFQHYLNQHGIIHQFSCPYTPQQNGVAERKNRHLLEVYRAITNTAHLPHTLWPELLATAAYLINILPSPNTHNKSPHHILFNKPPQYTHLRTPGCLCFPWLQPHSPHKFAPRSKACVFIGYAPNHKGYLCHDPLTNQSYISRHVIFYENSFPYINHPTSPPSNLHTPEPTPTPPPLTLTPVTATATSPSLPPSLSTGFLPESTSPCSPSNSTTPSHHPSNSPPLTASSDLPTITSPIRHEPPPQAHRHPMITRTQTGHLKPKPIYDLAHTLHPNPPITPTTYSAAAKIPHWQQAMQDEFQALTNQHTWHLVPPSPNQNLLGSKWTFRIKYHSDGTIARYKARLVAQGFKQMPGIDYNQTFSPVAKFPTIRTFLTIATYRRWPITQLDISNAFLHGPLTDTVFMTQPPGFKDPQKPHHVCHLQKAIYGLKQSPRQWYTTFSSTLQSLGFSFSSADPSLMTYLHNSVELYILIYVDDILLTGNQPSAISQLLSQLQQHFPLKNLGKVSTFLGISILPTTQGLHLNQSHYAIDILNRAGMSSCKPLHNPSPSKSQPTEESNLPFSDPTHFRQIVGALQFLTTTRPDLSYSVNYLCQQLHRPLQIHYKHLKRLLRYLQGTLNLGINIYPDEPILHAYSDSDWAGDPADRKSTSGYCAFLGRTLISWSAKKQPTVARSSTEAEYRALATAASDITWLRRLLSDFRLPVATSTTLFCDNASAIALANNPVFHARTKHIEVDYHFIRDCIHANTIKVQHMPTEEQLADIFTKPLPVTRYNHLRDKLTLTPRPSTCGGILKQQIQQDNSNHQDRVHYCTAVQPTA